jgi:aspartate carbamoyltransferase catalytic subunit
VASVPERIDEAAVNRARERAKKLRWFLKGAIDHGGHSSSEFERLLNALKVMFASPEELKAMSSETEETKASASE